jgi:FtsP/CotA-like multicopper oxidase with cupredoxin domain
MPTISVPDLRRRHFLAGAACVLSATSRPALAVAGRLTMPDELTVLLRAGPARVHIVDHEFPQTEVWTYNSVEPGPVLRVRQGTPFRATAENRLAEGTTVHWHGIRLPNAMDGVPAITQKAIPPGSRFDYAFTPPDAGTFLYHSHDDSLVQMGRGLAGPLIVEETDPPFVDRELLWTIQDWRLTQSAQIAPGFDNRMEEAMDGRIGNTVTLNGCVPDSVHVRAGERVRLRLINAATARIMALRFDGHRPVIVALDGQPCDPHEPPESRVLLGPAMRADVMLDMQGEPGQSYLVVDDFYDRLSYTLVRLSYDPASPLRTHPSDTPLRLPRNPVPRPDLAAAIIHEVHLEGGMMGGMGGGMMGMGGKATWAMNGQSMTGDGSANMPPLFQIASGRSCILDIHNETAWWHPMHLHGHSFHVLNRDGLAVPHDQWGDTVLVRPHENVQVAFVADNPGDWMLHCHVMDHQVGGMMTMIRVA